MEPFQKVTVSPSQKRSRLESPGLYKFKCQLLREIRLKRAEDLSKVKGHKIMQDFLG